MPARRRKKSRRGLGEFVKQRKGAHARAGRVAHEMAAATGKRAYWCFDEKRDGYVVDTRPHGSMCSSWSPGLGKR